MSNNACNDFDATLIFQQSGVRQLQERANIYFLIIL